MFSNSFFRIERWMIFILWLFLLSLRKIFAGFAYSFKSLSMNQ